jgi:hypothetical protein
MTSIIIGLIVFNLINIPLYVFLFKKFFADWEEFKEALLFYIKPDLFSLIRGQFVQDIQAELKLVLFFVVCATVLVGEMLLMEKILSFF